MNLMALALLLIFQCLGEGVAHGLNIAVPGPVIGMLLLFIAFLIRPELADSMEKTSWGILQHLSLLFVPAGVGVIVSQSQISGNYVAISVCLVVSTVLAIAVCALVTNAAMRYMKHHESGEG